MQDQHNPADEGTLPYLEYYPAGGGDRQRIILNRFPFLIGRSQSADHTIYSRQVSKQHAEIERVGDHLQIRDLGSTNGTFVNGQRIAQGPLLSGDIVHFARCEFCFVHEPSGASSVKEAPSTAPTQNDLPASVIRANDWLRDLLEKQSVAVLFQPIVDLHTQEALGHEALGRSPA